MKKNLNNPNYYPGVQKRGWNKDVYKNLGYGKFILPDGYAQDIKHISTLIDYPLSEFARYKKEGEYDQAVLYCDTNCAVIDDPCDRVQQKYAVENFFDGVDCNQLYHFILKFDTAAYDLRGVYEIACDIQWNFFAGYKTVFVIHRTRDNIHIHFITDPVSALTGKKWHLNGKTWKRLKGHIEFVADSYFHGAGLQSLLE